jgi:hypothetical protein
MNPGTLDRLAETGNLDPISGDQSDFDRLVRTAFSRLSEARTPGYPVENRFAAAYDAARFMALAALHWHGYHTEDQDLVFRCLPQTLGVGPDVWQVLTDSHRRIRLASSHGLVDVDTALATDLIGASGALATAVDAMAPIEA